MARKDIIFATRKPEFYELVEELGYFWNSWAVNKLDAFRNSKNHKASHSLLLVLATTFGLDESIHNHLVNAEMTLKDLFEPAE